MGMVPEPGGEGWEYSRSLVKFRTFRKMLPKKSKSSCNYNR